MCGICGAFGLSGPPGLDLDELELMLLALQKRGPDKTYRFTGRRAILGATRLAVIDLEGGHQPAKNEDGNISVIFNGEIYNYISLAGKELKDRHTFASRADTEILPHLYEEYGEKMFEKLNGMFAIALYDARNEKFYLARDRFGEKPLYYFFAGETLYFASELKALLAVQRLKTLGFGILDPLSVAAYLRFEYIPAPYSIFKNVRKLLPGHYLEVQGNKKKLRRFFSLNFTGDMTDEREITERLEKLINDSVSSRLISDVPLGIFLSGGLDSSLITAIASKHLSGSRKPETFTIGFHEKDFDESCFARKVALHTGSIHHEEFFSAGDLLDLLPEAYSYLDEPLGDASYLPTFLLSKFARKRVTVALGGDGGDELFYGYPTYQAHNFIFYYNLLPPPFASFISKAVRHFLPVSIRNISTDFKIRRFISGYRKSPLERHAIWMGAFDDLSSILTAQYYGIIQDITVERFFSPILASCNSSSLYEKISYLDLFTYLSDDILVKVDRASMANSLECRAPFLDHNIAMLLARIPARLKFDGFQLKLLLRKIARKYLPAEIVSRDKKGFGIPVARWIKKELLPLVREKLSRKRLEETGIFNPDRVQILLEEHLSGRADNRKQLFTLLVFELWRDNFCPR